MQGMGTLLARNWWAVALRGVIALLFGLVVLVWPGITLAVLVTFFGAFALISGIFALIAAFRSRRRDEPWWVLLLQGLVSVVAGVIALIWPGIAALILLYYIAAWAIVVGIIEIIAAIQLRKAIQNEWLLVVAGIASLLFGILLVIRPGVGVLAVLWLIAAYAIIFGVLLLVLGFRLRNWNKQGAPPVV